MAWHIKRLQLSGKGRKQRYWAKRQKRMSTEKQGMRVDTLGKREPGQTTVNKSNREASICEIKGWKVNQFDKDVKT